MKIDRIEADGVGESKRERGWKRVGGLTVSAGEVCVFVCVCVCVCGRVTKRNQ